MLSLGLNIWRGISSGGAVAATASLSWESDSGVTGSPASAWAALAGAITLAQASSGNRPAVTANAFGTVTGLTFDGSNDCMSYAGKAITRTGASSLAVVFKTPSAFSAAQVIVSQSDTATANNWFEFGLTSTGKLYVESNVAGTKQTVNGATTLLPSTVYAATLCYDGTDYFMTLSNVEENPLTIENIGAFAWFGVTAGTSAFTVGGTLTSSGIQRCFGGVLGGIYFYDQDITA